MSPSIMVASPNGETPETSAGIENAITPTTHPAIAAANEILIRDIVHESLVWEILIAEDSSQVVRKLILRQAQDDGQKNIKNRRLICRGLILA